MTAARKTPASSKPPATSHQPRAVDEPPATSHQPPATAVFTIGHSTRSQDEFIALLRAHDIKRLADIRTIPRSRRHPHFSIDALSRTLPEAGIAYRHMPGLGGLRKPRRDSTNSGWRNGSFRGYADYMESGAFEQALDELIAWAASPERESLRSSARSLASGGGVPRAVIMCSEAVWWRCHRQLVADALVARGIAVRHITSARQATAHALTDFARVVDGRVTYPGLV
jgi:uncharacterized protein (DUF488 family)